MGYILVLLVSVSLAGTSLDEREKSNKKFRKEFKEQYGYEWGSYGFNMDCKWEGAIDNSNPQRQNDRDDDSEKDGESGV